jgi:hypothetical protein
MTQFNLVIVDKIFDLIKEEDLNTKFGKYKLQHKLKLMQSMYPNNSTISETVNYIIDNMLCKPVYIEDPQRFVNLRSHYTEQEVKNINKIFGFVANNEELNENLLEFGYRQNENIPGARDLYYELKWKYFRPNQFNSELEEKQARNLGDMVNYASEQQ